jgi:hypothetical protein
LSFSPEDERFLAGKNCHSRLRGVSIVISAVSSVCLSCGIQGGDRIAFEVIGPGAEHEILAYHIVMELFNVFSAILDSLLSSGDFLRIRTLSCIDGIEHLHESSIYCAGCIAQGLLPLFILCFVGLSALS